MVHSATTIELKICVLKQKFSARILPIWGEFLKREEKGEEKKELDRGLHIFTPIACSVSSRVKAQWFFRDGQQGKCGN